MTTLGELNCGDFEVGKVGDYFLALEVSDG